MTQLPATQSNPGESKGLKPSLWAVSGHSIQHLTDILSRKKNLSRELMSCSSQPPTNCSYSALQRQLRERPRCFLADLQARLKQSVPWRSLWWSRTGWPSQKQREWRITGAGRASGKYRVLVNAGLTSMPAEHTVQGLIQASVEYLQRGRSLHHHGPLS